MLEIACMIEAGKRAPKNDDRAAINSTLVSHGTYAETVDKSCLVVICDGVGGEAYGNEAAEIVTNIFSRLSNSAMTVESIKNYIEKANDAIITVQKRDVKHSKMATTIAGLYINEDDFIAFNAGDSRIYRYRSFLNQISRDHSLWQEQIDRGLHPQQGQKNVITQYIGSLQVNPEIVEGNGRVFDNDLYILCTDGVWGVLADDDFEKILSQDCKIENMCRSLVNLALEKGSDDNLGIIIARRIKNG